MSEIDPSTDTGFGSTPPNHLLSDEMLPEAPAVSVATPNPMAETAAVASNNVANVAETTTATFHEPNTTATTKPTKRWTWKKPAGKPNRPLSAYNLFFADTRANLETPLDFVSLASHVAKKWNGIDEKTKAEYQAKARIEKEKYQKEIELWKKANEEDEPPSSKKLKTDDCANCPVCLAKAQNNSIDLDGPYYIISCTKEFARQLANANIPGFQATFIADPTTAAIAGGFDYAAAIEEALQASAEPALDKQAIDKLVMKLEEQRSLAALRQQTQQMEFFEQTKAIPQPQEPPPTVAATQESNAFETKELINEATPEEYADGNKKEEEFSV